MERCLTARKLGIDIGSSFLLVSFLVDNSLEKIANQGIQDILSGSKFDLQTLENLKSRLSEFDSMIRPVEFYFKAEQEVMTSYMTPEQIQLMFKAIGSSTFKDNPDRYQFAHVILFLMLMRNSSGKIWLFITGYGQRYIQRFICLTHKLIKSL